MISPQLTLWNKEGSNVSTGNLLVIPIESSLLYVVPIYLESTSTKIPEMKRVIVALGNRVVMEPTLNEAMASVVGGPIAAAPPMGGAPTQTAAKLPKVPGAPSTATSAEVTRLINQAVSHYGAAEEAQRSGDWAAYGEHIAALKKTLKELQSKAR